MKCLNDMSGMTPNRESRIYMASLKDNKTPSAEALFLEAERCEENRNFRAAFKHLLAAAQLGHAMSQVSLGNFYASGRGVRKDLEEAANWYRKAYRNGYRDGALNLAIDKRKQGELRSAVVWFKKAIAMNSGDACVELAKIYLARRGEQKSAASLLKRALRMSRDNISADTKKTAESLLKTTTKA
jgi:TPR repeat protein